MILRKVLWADLTMLYTRWTYKHWTLNLHLQDNPATIYPFSPDRQLKDNTYLYTREPHINCVTNNITQPRPEINSLINQFTLSAYWLIYGSANVSNWRIIHVTRWISHVYYWRSTGADRSQVITFSIEPWWISEELNIQKQQQHTMRLFTTT